MTTPTNKICLMFNKSAEEAANFYAKTFPNSKVEAIYRAPSDFPSGKKDDVLTVEFTVAGFSCVGVNGGDYFKHTKLFLFRLPLTLKKKLISFGMQSSKMVGKLQNVLLKR